MAKPPEKKVNLSKMFQKIKFSPALVISDSIFGSLLAPFECCCKNSGCFTRPKILEKCEEKFTDEMEVTALLKKIRDSHDMLKNLQDKKF